MNESSKFSIYHLNLFKPNPLGIYHVAVNQDKDQLAIIKKHLKPNSKIGVVSIIEVYRIPRNSSPRLTQSIVRIDNLTGIAWIDSRFLIVAGKEQTIVVYDTYTGAYYDPIITDYGPILCMQYLPFSRLLITGTEYGYVGSYKISRLEEFKWLIEPISKMVKISGPIEAIDVHFRIREDVQPIPEEPQWPQVKPKKRKRKRKNTDESDSGDTTERSWLDDKVITIYGATGPEIVAWNFHKTTIIDTMRIGIGDSSRVCSVMSLRNGDVVVGDSLGTLSIFDHKSLTCRQSMKVLEAEILSLSKDTRDEKIIAGGVDPSIVFLKRDCVNTDEFFLGERIEFHTHPITSLKFINPKLFFSAALDGYLAKFEKFANQLKRTVVPPSFKNQVQFSNNEMMARYDRSVMIWTLPGIDYESLESLQGDEVSDLKPEKSVVVKASSYIFSSAFTEKWVAYSTSEGLHVRERTEDGLKHYQTKRRIQPCKSLIICKNGQFIIGCHQRFTSIIRLDTSLPPEEEGGPPILDVAYGHHSRLTSISLIMYIDSLDLIVSASAAPHSMIFIDKLSIGDDGQIQFKKVNRIRLFEDADDGISFMVHNPLVTQNDPHLFIYRNNDELVKISIDQKYGDKLTGRKIEELPESSVLLGMIFIDENCAIAWDQGNFYKICLNEYRVINQNSDYGSIIELYNGLFDDCHNIALAELTDDAYRAALPAVKDIRKKFGA